ncbi:hypothetical protein BAUCODRAFT_36690 [Baudoinia panamericana UAMH 10762]|uniref:NmrA-like domain-containing protein n=1 Tax=Baudoinia panamericana (strain UAMH 10762) TaxID=717646 RepID=M2MCG9_BAUPA|nr:uncharacterized protein BAUCODRAFT_36690 [Baudoinia panamericana UAMH 10762]EMC94216.1 hypothetical protein BAUCODRAFT_36690 [Baudoinia panamericana UAMH 10762]
MSHQYVAQQPSGFKNNIEKVAVVGATGSVGKYITEELLKTGKHIVTALTRTDSESTMPKGVQVARVDYSSEDSIVDSLKGQEFLIITMSTRAPRDTQSKLINAAAKAGVKWVMPNEYSPDYVGEEAMGRDVMNFGQVQLGARQLIESHGMSWTALCCSHWYEFSLAGSQTRYGFDFQSKTVTYYDGGDVKINHSTWPQCGRAVAKLLSLKLLPEDESDKAPTLSQFRNKPLYISSFLLSQNDMLAAVLKATGDKESDWTIQSKPVTERYQDGINAMQKGDMLGFATAMYARVFYPEGSPGDYESKGKLANDILGLPKEDLNEATKNAVRMAETGEGLYH